MIGFRFFIMAMTIKIQFLIFHYSIILKLFQLTSIEQVKMRFYFKMHQQKKTNINKQKQFIELY